MFKYIYLYLVITIELGEKMSSKSVKRKHEDVRKCEVAVEDHFDLKRAVISFSKLSEYSTPEYIYTGQERIPFKNRHPEYQSILRNEFAVPRREFNKFMSKGKFSVSF